MENKLALNILAVAALLIGLVALSCATFKAHAKTTVLRTLFYLCGATFFGVVFCMYFYVHASNDEQITLKWIPLTAASSIAVVLTGLGVALSRSHKAIDDERRLGDRSRTFHTLFNITRGGLMLVDTEGRLMNVNPSCMPLFGYERAQLMALRIQELIDLSTKQLSGALGLVDATEGSGVIETIARRKDGQLLHLQLTCALIPDSGGQLFVILRDITERKNAEGVRTRLEAQLRHSQKLEAIGTLASGIAHDFNNVLSAILGNVELAKADLDQNSPALASMLEIRKAGQRAKELVGRIVGFARPQDNRRRALQLQAVVEDAVKLVRATLPASVEIHCSYEPDLPLVKVDDSQISQVLLNLCTNAYQAFAQGAGRLEISIDSRTFSVDESAQHMHLRAGRYVCLHLQDNGCGIDSAIAERVFEPFFTTRPRGEGTGLGLSVVHTIVRSHGGAITFDSVPGQGTTFHVLLPAAANDEQADAPETLPASIAAAPQGAQQHILYVDDEEPLVFLTKRILERKGYRVSGFTDPKLALAEFMAHSDQYQLFITDQAMPGMCGTDLAREILREKPDTKIILVSGYLRPDEIDQALQLGVREVILKPNSVDELASAVHKIVSGE